MTQILLQIQLHLNQRLNAQLVIMDSFLTVLHMNHAHQAILDGPSVIYQNHVLMEQ